MSEPIARPRANSRLSEALAAVAALEARDTALDDHEHLPANVHPDMLVVPPYDSDSASTSDEQRRRRHEQQQYRLASSGDEDGDGGMREEASVSDEARPAGVGGGTGFSFQPHMQHVVHPRRLATSCAGALSIPSGSYRSTGSGGGGGVGSLFMPTTGRSYYAATIQTDDDEESDHSNYLVSSASIRQQSLALGDMDLRGEDEAQGVATTTSAATAAGAAGYRRWLRSPPSPQRLSPIPSHSPRSTSPDHHQQQHPLKRILGIDVGKERSSSVSTDKTVIVTTPSQSRANLLDHTATAATSHPDEETPLLVGPMREQYTMLGLDKQHATSIDTTPMHLEAAAMGEQRDHYRSPSEHKQLRSWLSEAVLAMPAVILGLMLNLLDAVSYG
ncbi:hypothetical protein SYNPS1DRAFT_29618 [Syncephalis pseudoplumigaleata]|uniref:Uncharacterized protein n=1 Tax=Syncephalis pseudoplumigaleata TaxID=1712513 RepID=A0A4P9YXL2_9FUNG|nr:hypothetical protein SYNPS1DRAFT_29618 [Syncephalis pseudoplumigaleata]|eukprot:RKP24625.1 hypothetical protein SYNPS1DRAFT_29618 [Syncephalis pseudoplumigaleata]